MLGKQDALAEIAGRAKGLGCAPAKHKRDRCGRIVPGIVYPEGLEQAYARQCKETIIAISDAIREEDCRVSAKKAIKSFGHVNPVLPCEGIVRDGPMISKVGRPGT